jgi:acyl dehydratase
MDLPFDLGALGTAGPPHAYAVTPEAIRAYAEATDDPAPAARAGRVAPPVFAIVPAWETIAPASRAVASEEARRRVVHYDQDMHLHRPIEAGMALVSRAAPIGLHARSSGTALVIRTETRTEDGALVGEQYVTELFRGVTAPAEGGEVAPDHRLPDAARGEEPTAEISYPVAPDQPERYAAASGDRFAIHLDDAAARAVGLPGRILHGLCTMAFTARAVLEAAGSDDPALLRRVAVRFSAPVRPGDAVTTRVWRLDGGAELAYEATDSGGRTIIKDGRAELRP